MFGIRASTVSWTWPTTCELYILKVNRYLAQDSRPDPDPRHQWQGPWCLWQPSFLLGRQKITFINKSVQLFPVALKCLPEKALTYMILSLQICSNETILKLYSKFAIIRTQGALTECFCNGSLPFPYGYLKWDLTVLARDLSYLNINNNLLYDGLVSLVDKLAQTQVVINWQDTVATNVHQWRFGSPRF